MQYLFSDIEILKKSFLSLYIIWITHLKHRICRGMFPVPQHACPEQGTAALFACPVHIPALAEGRAGGHGISLEQDQWVQCQCHWWVPRPPLWVAGCKEFLRDRTVASASWCSCLSLRNVALKKRLKQWPDLKMKTFIPLCWKLFHQLSTDANVFRRGLRKSQMTRGCLHTIYFSP